MLVFACSASACADLAGLGTYRLCTSDCEDGAIDAAAGPPVDAWVGEASATESGFPDAPVDDAPAIEASGGDAGHPAQGGDAAGADADAGPSPSGCSCIPQPPSGWTGYVQVVVGDGGAGSCASPYGGEQGTKRTSPSGSPARCTPCTCGYPPSGPITCEVSLGSGGTLCAGETMTVAPQGLCVIPPGPVGLTSGPNGDSYGPTAVPTPAGSCAADGGTLAQPLTPATWSTLAICTSSIAPAQGCPSAGDTCVPVPPAQAGSPSGACIYRAGVQTCPPATFTMAFVAADGIVDTRGCGSCSCGTPGCPSDGFVQGYTSPNCTGAVAATFDASTPCTLGDNANGSVSFVYTPSHAAWAGTCAPSGGAPAGTVTLDDSSATTYCCIP